jgi:hypothetical protein
MVGSALRDNSIRLPHASSMPMTCTTPYVAASPRLYIYSACKQCSVGLCNLAHVLHDFIVPACIARTDHLDDLVVSAGT